MSRQTNYEFYMEVVGEVFKNDWEQIWTVVGVQSV
jgi:hypothetical protein